MDDVRMQLQSLLPAAIRHRPWVGETSARQHDLPARENIFRSGDSLQRVYFVARGWLRGSTALAENVRPLSNLYIRGDIIGLPWIGQLNQIEDVTTITHCELISVPAKQFQDWRHKDSFLQTYIQDELVRETINLRMMNAVIGQRKAPDRLAFFLFLTFQRIQRTYRTQTNALSLPMTQEEIGRMLGLTNVSVNRAFRALESQGRIATARQTVTFLDQDWFRERFDFNSRENLIEQMVGTPLEHL